MVQTKAHPKAQRESVTISSSVEQGRRCLLTIVGCALAELYSAQHIGDHGDAAGDTAQRRELLLGGLPLVVLIDQGDVVEGRMVVSGGRVGAFALGDGGAILNVRWSLSLVFCHLSRATVRRACLSVSYSRPQIE